MPSRSVGPAGRFGERPDHPHVLDGLLRLMSAALNDNRRRDMAIECKRCGGPTMPETVIKLRRGLLGFHETRWQGGYCATCRLSALAKLGCLPVSDRPRRPRRVDAVRRDRRVTLSNAVDPENTSYQDQHDRPPGAADAADSRIAGRLSGGCSISPTRSAASIRPGAMIPSVSGETRLN